MNIGCFRHHLEFLWCNMVASLLYTKEHGFLTIAATILRRENSRWRHAGNLNAKTAVIHIKCFGTLKLSFHVLEK